MTDSPTPADPGPLDPDAELASAHLDGEAGPDERDRAEDPVVVEHLATFAALSERVRDVPAPPDGLFEDQVVRAMAAFDDSSTVVSMGRVGAGAQWWQRIPLGAVAAALVVVALVGAIGLASRGADEDDTATGAFDAAGETDAVGDASGGSEDTMSAVEPDSAEIESAPSAGTAAGGGGSQAFADHQELAASLRDELATPAASAAPGGGDGQEPATSGRTADGEATATSPADACGAVALLGLDPASVVLVRSVVVGPDPVTAVVHDATDGRRLTVVDDVSCTVVVDRLL